MNDDLIRRDDAIKAINKALDKETLLYSLVRKIAVDAIRSIPSTDRPQGEWNPYFTKKEYNDTFNCNLCGDMFIVMQGKEEMNFCPNCGARMKGASDND